MAPLAPGERQYSKNQALFKAGDPANKIYILTQGLVSICATNPQGLVELYKVSPPQLIGEEVLRGEATYSSTAIALNDAIVVEVSASTALNLISGATPLIRSLAKGMLSKQDRISVELKKLRFEANEALPCPYDRVAKLFSVIYRVATYTGKKKNSKTSVEWNSFRKYCQRVFLESPVRLEQAVWMLTDLKFAEVQMIPDETDPDAPEQMGYIHFRNLEPLSAFAEFYRKNFNPKVPREIWNSPGAQSKTVSAILKAIDYWNTNGAPKGVPAPPQKKKVA